MRIFAPQDFSPWRKIPQIPKSRITHMVTSNGGHPLHCHLRHSGRLSNSLFNRRTTKFQTFTQWLQASALQHPSGLRGHLFSPQQTEYSQIWLYVLGLSRTRINKKKKLISCRNGRDWNFSSLYRSHLIPYQFDFLHSSWKWMRFPEQNNFKQILMTLSHSGIV